MARVSVDGHDVGSMVALVERIFRSMDVRGFKIGMSKVTRVEVVDFILQTTDIGPLGSMGMLPDCRIGS